MAQVFPLLILLNHYYRRQGESRDFFVHSGATVVVCTLAKFPAHFVNGGGGGLIAGGTVYK